MLIFLLFVKISCYSNHVLDFGEEFTINIFSNWKVLCSQVTRPQKTHIILKQKDFKSKQIEQQRCLIEN